MKTSPHSWPCREFKRLYSRALPAVKVKIYEAAGRTRRRAALADAPAPRALVFATATPAYADKTNAAIVHAALALDESVPAYDYVGSVRSGIGALVAAADAAATGRATRDSAQQQLDCLNDLESTQQARNETPAAPK